MSVNSIRKPAWKVLLIGGSSGVGKTVLARQLAHQLSLSVLLLDDVRIAMQAGTSAETNPDLHVFLQYSAGQWSIAESIVADWIRVGRAMTAPLAAIIRHHIVVPDVGRVIIEGDGILPTMLPGNFETDEVRSLFIVEQDREQLLKNMFARRRGFEEWGKAEQQGFVQASWLYGQWLAQEANRLDLPVIAARPHDNILERVLSIIAEP
jgi:2-phosphoglycerate kinase